MKSVAVLLSVHGRRQTPLECLRSCYWQIDSMKEKDVYSFSVYMVDDGCAPAVMDEVRESFPQTIIIRGDGNLYWNQGMRLAWETAAKEGYDFYLWVKNGLIFKEKALSCIMETSEFLRHRAIVACTGESVKGELCWGGRSKSGKLIEPDPVIPVPCYTFDGTLVLVPSRVYMTLGNLDEHYSNRLGDMDYGVRAVKAKIVRVVAPGVLCTCAPEFGRQPWRDGAYSLGKRLEILWSPEGCPPHEQFLFDCRRQNFFFAIVHFLSIIVRVLFPLR